MTRDRWNLDPTSLRVTLSVLRHGPISRAELGLSTQVLQEFYATQHAIGAVGWLEVDAKIQVEQAIAQLKMKSA